MAADPTPAWISALPPRWSYGLTRDGRVFFINEEAKSTSWLHPVTGEALLTGHRKSADLPAGWEEGFTFEGARCFINHNERKVTCKHPVSGAPSQDNCIFVVNEQPPSKPAATEKKERPISTMSEASNYTGTSDHSIQQNSPTARPSRSLKKVHNFGKRSNSIKRNPNAAVVKRNWLYKQDSTGMKMWKKRWFVLSDMCLFYYKDEKEEGILGSILLPSFHISMLSVDDHISKKYAFKATHPNMRTYYFCTDTSKEMESWMKVMTDAALVHTEPIRRLERITLETQSPPEINNINHWVLTQPEIRNNERNRENLHPEEKKQKSLNKQGRTPREMDFSRKLPVEKDGQTEAPQTDEGKILPQEPVENLLLQVDAEIFARQTQCEPQPRTTQTEGTKHCLHQDGKKFSLQKPEDLQKDHERYQKKDGARLRRQDSAQREIERPQLQIGDRYSFQKGPEQALTNISGRRPAQTLSSSPSTTAAGSSAPHKAAELNGSEGNGRERLNPVPQRTSAERQELKEPKKDLSRTSSMLQLEQWVKTYHSRVQDEDNRSITSYQTLPRNMPSHRTQVVPKYPEGYRTLPRNMLRPDSICSVASSVYDCVLQPTAAAKRRSVRDDTLWQLYEWQQRQAYSRMGYGTLPCHGTMSHIAESIPSSPSHGSLTTYRSVSQSHAYNPNAASELLSSPELHGELSIDRRHRAHLPKYAYPPECRTPAAQSITQQSLQDKTPEELTLLLIKLRRQQAELTSIREQTLAQLMQLNLSTNNPKSKILSHHRQRNLLHLDKQMKVEENRVNVLEHKPEDLDVDVKLSRLCEQGKVVRGQEEKLQQLHREKHTLETALLSASQDIQLSADNPAALQTLIQQRDVLQSGLLSTCRELQRVHTELNRSWMEYEDLEAEVTLAKSRLLEQLEALGSPQTEPPSQQHVQIQKELWRIQDVMDALNKNKPKRCTEPNDSVSALQKEGPDYRLYKSEPELTTVTEVDESNGEEKLEPSAEKEPSLIKAFSPLQVMSSRTKSPVPVSSSIASYVTLRKSKKPESKAERPHSVVEPVYGGGGGGEGARQRMSVEEQMERIRRHQQGALRERRKEDGSLSRSLSFTRDPQHYYTLQLGRRRREPSGGELFHRRTPALLKENYHVNNDEPKTTACVRNPAEERSEAAQSHEQRAQRESSDPQPITEHGLETAVMIHVKSEQNDDDDDDDEDEGQDSYHLLSSKLNTMVSARPITSLNADT